MADSSPSNARHPTRTKVTVVGAGAVGMACAVSILTGGLCDEMCVIDVVVDKLKGEVMDLQHGAVWFHNAIIVGSDNYAQSAGSSIVVLTAGARQKVGESRRDLAQRNVDIYKAIVPQIAKYSPDAILVVISNPADVMTYVAWKVSGFPPHRVFGTGTSLDTSRFCHLIGQRFGLGPSSVNAFVIGEHGDSSVPVWSSANVVGVPIDEYAQSIGIASFKDEYSTIHTQVVEAAMEIIKLKGYTNWGIGMTCAGIVRGIVHNTKDIHPVSTLLTGTYGVETNVFLSAPCVIGGDGLMRIVQLHLSDTEKEQFAKSVSDVWGICETLKFD